MPSTCSAWRRTWPPGVFWSCARKARYKRRSDPAQWGYGWYPLVPGTPPNPQELWTARDHIVKFLDAAADRYPIDPKKLGIVGFSQGGVMAYTLALGAPQRFAAVAALSTWCPPDAVENVADPDTVQYLATLVQHGSRDELVSVERARESVEALRAPASSPHLPRIRYRPRNQPAQPG